MKILNRLSVIFLILACVLGCSDTEEPKHVTKILKESSEIKFTNELDESQISYINKCKRDGKMGCSLTINNCQVFVSFYEPLTNN